MENKNNQNALEAQVAGNHYKNLRIQPVEYIHANNIGFMEGNVIKYVTRWKAKNGIEDLKKAKHHLEMLIQLEEDSLKVTSLQDAVKALRLEGDTDDDGK